MNPIDSFNVTALKLDTTRNMTNTYLRLLSELPSNLMYGGMDLDITINQALHNIGSTLDVSRAYVMLDERDGRYLRNTHEWVQDSVAPAVHSWPLHDYEYDIPSLKPLLENKSVFAGNTKDLPKDLNLVLAKQDVVSFMFSPMLRDGNWVGLVGLDFCRGERRWTEEEEHVLRIIADLICIALERKQYLTIRKKLDNINVILSETAYVDDNVRVHPVAGKPMSLKEYERRIVKETLELYHGNKLRAAKHLGLTWPAMDRRCKKLGINVKKDSSQNS